MSEGTDLRAQVQDLLLEFGRDVTLTRSTLGTYNNTTGEAAETEADYSGRGRVGMYRDRMVDGTLIRATDRRVTWQPDDGSFIPQEGDRVTFGEELRTVIRITTREIGGDWVVYTLQVR